MGRCAEFKLNSWQDVCRTVRDGLGDDNNPPFYIRNDVYKWAKSNGMPCGWVKTVYFVFQRIKGKASQASSLIPHSIDSQTISRPIRISLCQDGKLGHWRWTHVVKIADPKVASQPPWAVLRNSFLLMCRCVLIYFWGYIRNWSNESAVNKINLQEIIQIAPEIRYKFATWGQKCINFVKAIRSAIEIPIRQWLGDL